MVVCAQAVHDRQVYKQQQSRSAIEGSRETRLFRGDNGAQNLSPEPARAVGCDNLPRPWSSVISCLMTSGVTDRAGVQGDRFNKGELFGMLNLLDTGMRHKVCSRAFALHGVMDLLCVSSYPKPSPARGVHVRPDSAFASMMA